VNIFEYEKWLSEQKDKTEDGNPPVVQNVAVWIVGGLATVLNQKTNVYYVSDTKYYKQSKCTFYITSDIFNMTMLKQTNNNKY